MLECCNNHSHNKSPWLATTYFTYNFINGFVSKLFHTYAHLASYMIVASLVVWFVWSLQANATMYRTQSSITLVSREIKTLIAFMSCYPTDGRFHKVLLVVILKDPV